MITPINLLKGILKTIFNFQSFFTWVSLITIFFGAVVAIKRFFFAPQINNSRRGQYQTSSFNLKTYFVIFLIIICIFSIIWFSFIKKSKSQVQNADYKKQLIGDLDNHLQTLGECVNRYQGTKDFFVQHVNEIEKAIEECYAELDLNKQEQAKYQKEYSTVKSKIDSIKENLKNINGNITILQGQIQELEQQKKEKEQQQREKENKLKEKTDIIERAKLQEEIKQLQTEINAINQKILEIRYQIDCFKIRIKAHEKDLQICSTIQQNIEKNFYLLSQDGREIFDKLRDFEYQKNEAQKVINELDTKINETKKIINDVENFRNLMMQCLMAGDDYVMKNSKNWCDVASKALDVTESYIGGSMIKCINTGRNVNKILTPIKNTLSTGEGLRHSIKGWKTLFLDSDGNPKLLGKESYEIISRQLEQDIKKIENDVKDYEVQKQKYINDSNKETVHKKSQTFDVEETKYQDTQFGKLRKYSEYIQKIDAEKSLSHNSIPQLEETLTEENQNLTSKKIELETKKEELNQTVPSRKNIQKRIVDKTLNRQHLIANK